MTKFFDKGYNHTDIVLRILNIKKPFKEGNKNE